MILEIKKHIKHFFASAKNSIAGLKAIRSETAFQQEVIITIIAIFNAIIWDFSTMERILLIGVWFIVLIVEVLNTAIEATVDRIGLERHELSGLAKDLGSTAVLIALIFAGLTWLLIIVG